MDNKSSAPASEPAEQSLETEQQPDEPSKKTAGPNKPGWRGKFTGLSSFYLWIFILLIITVILVAFTVYRWQFGPGSNKASKAVSLTSQELAQLQGNTTLVGDSKQTLDIQGNSVFEGQVLVRSDLSVAGGVKIGGALSLPSLGVNGSGAFGQLQVNDTFSVAGATNFQGSVSLQKTLSVAGAASFGGSVSAGQLNVSSLQLTGDLQISRHITLGGGLPGKSNGSALGGGGTFSISGSDTAGSLTINTGSGPPAGCFGTINFSQKFGSTPHVVISPSNSAAAGLDYYANRNTTNFSVCTLGAPAAGTTYLFDYIVID